MQTIKLTPSYSIQKLQHINLENNTQKERVKSNTVSALRVLLVEDEVITQRVHTLFLKKIGCVVELAKNGVEALAMCQDQHYDLIFLDGGLPDIDGFDLAKTIRRNQGQQQPLIMLSAYPYEEVKVRCEMVGINAFAIKPVSIETLRSLVNCFVGKLCNSTVTPK